MAVSALVPERFMGEGRQDAGSAAPQVRILPSSPRRHPTRPTRRINARYLSRMVGINRFTGKPETDNWAHTQQSIGVILTTARLERFMRRAFGSDMPRLVDAPITPATVIDFYAAAAGAINEYEPRFKVSRMRVDDATQGHLTLAAEGVYYPRGHLGDFSVSIPKTVTVPL